MEQFATEEQQVEAIKRFWKENGMAIVLGVVLGLGGLYGWRWYNDSQIQSKEQASAEYLQVMNALDSDDLSQAKQFVEQSDSGYALLTALQLAKVAVDKGDLAEAAKQLSVVANSTQAPKLASIAQLRLARVEAEQDNVEAALAVLDKVNDEAFVAQVEEVRGDIYASQNMIEKAKQAYDAALHANEANQLVKMKRDNLSAVTNG